MYVHTYNTVRARERDKVPLSIVQHMSVLYGAATVDGLGVHRYFTRRLRLMAPWLALVAAGFANNISGLVILSMRVCMALLA